MRRLRRPPDLHVLVREHDVYSKIPAKAWAAYDKVMEQWKSDVRNDQALTDDASSATGAATEAVQTEVAGESEANMTIEDISEFAGASFIKLEDLQRDGPREEIIADCVPGKYGPELIFESGDQLSLNKTSIRTLRKAYGDDCRTWASKHVKCYAGQVPFKDGKEGMTDAALVEPITPPTSDGKLPPPKPKSANGGSGITDEIPF
jgi:hypothetical protein